MFPGIEQIQKLGQDNLDATVGALSTFSKGAQKIAAETAEYAKKSFESGSATLQKLTGASSVEKAVEIQNAYLRGAYEDFVSQSTKIGELYSSVTREALKPYEGFIAKPFAA
ncbi:phasin family protein [Microvirga flavescens]|uniref:phasin family protein n=1 Tax=Microvirga flavescens TaxID=2249811 RepID=UPI000DD705AB|nr:phasin family protein [Microvirga flavescens]